MPKVGENLSKEASMAGLKRLKPMQQEFLNNYLHKDMTQTAAAREAGYKNPSVSAVRLLQNSVVQERLQEMRLEAQAKALEAANATLYQDKYALETEVREARESAAAERGAAAESNRQVQHTTTAATTVMSTNSFTVFEMLTRWQDPTHVLIAETT